MLVKMADLSGHIKFVKGKIYQRYDSNEQINAALYGLEVTIRSMCDDFDPVIFMEIKRGDLE